MKKFVCICFVAVMLILCFPLSVLGAENIICYESNGSNAGAHKYMYDRWASPVNSYLVDMSNMLCRFQYDSTTGEMTAEYYSNDYEFVSAKKIDSELPIFGGFYFDGNNFFIVTGQNNKSERSDVECFRITKYDKNWNRLKSTGLYDCNTTVPFDAGSLRFADTGDYLLFRTSHEMYASNGVNHQANVTVELNKSTMEITDSLTKVWNTDGGYVSHSFNQFIKIENGKIVAVDHGDANPRSVCLSKYTTECTYGKFFGNSNVNTYDMLSIYGEEGDNDTGCTVGGFEISNSAYIVVGTSVEQNEEHFYDSIQNVYVSVLSKQGDVAKTTFITSYDDVTAKCPFLVKLSDDVFLLMWEHDNKLCYAKLDANGNMSSEIYEADASLSDCEPIVCDGNVVWYVWHGNEVSFFELNISDLNDISVSKIDRGHVYNVISVSEQNKVEAKCENCQNVVKGTVLTSDDFSLYTYTVSGNYFFESSSIPTRAHPDSTISFHLRKIAEVDFDALNIGISDTDVARISPMDGYSSDYFNVTFLKEGSVDIVVSSPFLENCKKTYTITVSHDYQTTVLKEPSCTEKGLNKLTCTTCNNITEVETAMLEHTYGTWISEQAATCTEKGTKGHYTCSVCKKNFDSDKKELDSLEIAARGHSYGTWISEQAATCTEKGTKGHYTCSVCKKNFDSDKKELGSLEIAANGHSFTAEVAKNTYLKSAATCTDNAIYYMSCSVCNRTSKNTAYEATFTSGAELGHSFTEFLKTVDYTCTTNGYDLYKCSRCDATTQKNVTSAAHRAESDYTVMQKASCEADGYKVILCSECNIELETRTIAKREHHLVDTRVATAATCISTGVMNQKCDCTETDEYAACVYTTTRVIEIDGNAHDYDNADCTKSAACTRCGVTTGGALGHEFGKEVVNAQYLKSEATCTETAVYYKSCVRCKLSAKGENESATFTVGTALGHSFTEFVKNVDYTCTTNGYDLYRCSRCEVTTQKNVTSAAHRAESEYTVMKRASCEADGYKAILCSECRAELETRTIAKREHHLVDTRVATAATCISTGVMNQKCDCAETDEYEACTYTTTKVIPAMGHDKISHEKKAATCTEKGYEAYVTCSRCNYTTFKEIAEKGHTPVTLKAVAATCTKTGLSEGKKCSVCGEILVAQKTIGALGMVIDTSNSNVRLSEDQKNLHSAVGQTAEQIIEATGKETQILNSDGTTADKTAKIASGMKIVLKDKDGNVIEEKTIIVLGDVGGDGDITAADARTALRASVGLDNLNEWQSLAANVDGGDISASDARMILRASVGLETLTF